MPSANIGLPVGSALLIFVARLIELRTRRNVVPGRVREMLTLRIFVACGAAMLLGSLAEFSLHYRQWDWRIYSAGMACAALSVFIRRRCIRALGQFWSLHNEIRDSHKLVVVGPFRWVRHPTYLSMILELLAGALVLNAPRTLAFVAVLFLPTLWVRIKTEEAALVEKFGEEYRAYQRSTPALIPRTIPKQR